MTEETEYTVEKRVSSINGSGKTEQQNNEIRTFSNTYTEINSKLIKDLNVRPGTMRLLEENTGRTLFNTNCSNIFLDSSPRVMEIKIKINKWDLIKLEGFFSFLNVKAFVQQRK